MNEIRGELSAILPEKEIIDFKISTIHRNGTCLILLDFVNDYYEIPRSTFYIIKSIITAKCIMVEQSIDNVMTSGNFLKMKLLGSRFCHDHPQGMISHSITHGSKTKFGELVKIDFREQLIWFHAAEWFLHVMKQYCSPPRGSHRVNLKLKLESCSIAKNEHMFEREVYSKIIKTVDMRRLADEYDKLFCYTRYIARLPGSQSVNRYVINSIANDDQSSKELTV